MLSRIPRQQPRTKLDRIVYMNMSSGNGGIVLDASETGLAFQAADRLEETGQIHFRFSMSPIDQLEIAGELVWTDDTRKRGGLKFIDLPEKAHKEIRGWMGGTQPDIPHPKVISRDRGKPVGTSGHKLPPAPARAIPASPRRLLAEPMSGVNPLAQTFSGKIGPFGSNTAESQKSEKVYLKEPRFGTQAAFIFATVAMAAVFGIAIGLASFAHRDQIGHSLIRLGEKLSGESHKRLSSLAPIVAPTPNPMPIQERAAVPTRTEDVLNRGSGRKVGRGENLLSDPNPRNRQTDQSLRPSPKVAIAVNVPGASREASGEPKIPENSQGDDNGQVEYSLARQYLVGASSPATKARAAGLLWIAVEKGNSEAELELADLYGRGEGVQKNCQQARILLAAARDRNISLAASESAELHVYGCM